MDTSSPTYPPQLIHENDQNVINPVKDNGARVIYLDVGQPVKVKNVFFHDFVFKSDENFNCNRWRVWVQVTVWHLQVNR